MTAFRFELLGERDGIRRGRYHTPHGTFETPCFAPVGTYGSVKGLTPEQVRTTGAELILANAYHLALRPGAARVAALGGLHRFTGWNGPMLTDSGGYQVFSLDAHCRVDDAGVTFRSVVDGAEQRLTPESALAQQRELGADIVMVLDQCPAADAPHAAILRAHERTLGWAREQRELHAAWGGAGRGQALFGIVQGGTDPALRAESARRTVALGFDGYGIGGLSVGETREEMLPALEAALAHLPVDRPRYLMGVGDPASLVEAVHLGVDQFDCVMQTRLGRHGTALTGFGRLNVKRAEFALSDEPIDPDCTCPVCTRHTRGYLRHLFKVGEPTASRLVSIHNVAWTIDLMARMRAAIVAGTFEAVRAEVLAVWG